jgi:RHS repeat-associated protein
LTQTLGGVTTNYTYGTGNDLLSTVSVGGTTTQTIGYTGDGDMANLSPGIQAPGGSLITTLGYNQNERLSAVKAGSSILATYNQDGFGQRLMKTISATNVTLYQYGQDGMLLEEATYKGVPQADYIYLDGRPIATLTSSGTLDFLHDDLLGTPQLATDSSQNIAWQARYEPFGGTSSVSGAITQNLRLPGQYYDVETGFNHNGFRDYLPDLGRYAEPDPLAMQGTSMFYDPTTGHPVNGNLISFDSGRQDFYAYTGDDPIDNMDPSGCGFIDCAEAIADLNSALDRLAEREAEHAAHGGAECDKMNHDKAIEQAKKQVRKALAKARTCLPEEKIREIEDGLNKMTEWAESHKTAVVSAGVGVGVVAGAILCPECIPIVAPIVAAAR